jgi:hypothetical protein
LDTVEIADSDLGFVDNSKFPCNRILTVNIHIELTGQPPQPPTSLLITILSILGATAAIVFGFWFYRTKISWRKYLAADD